MQNKIFSDRLITIIIVISLFFCGLSMNNSTDLISAPCTSSSAVITNIDSPVTPVIAHTKNFIYDHIMGVLKYSKSSLKYPNLKAALCNVMLSDIPLFSVISFIADIASVSYSNLSSTVIMRFIHRKDGKKVHISCQ